MTDKNLPRAAYRNCNQVAQEQIWKESVRKELVAAKKWEKNWGFMAEYDCKGNQRPRKELPKTITTTYYNTDSNSVPITSSQQYGARLSSNSTHSMFKLEKLTSFHRRKTDIGKCYY